MCRALLRLAAVAAVLATATQRARADDAIGVAAVVPPPPVEQPKPNYLVPAFETAAITIVMLGWNNYVGSAPWARVGASTIGRNVTTPWVLDQDRYWINQVGHPYQGVWPYSAARSSGVEFWRSGAYAFAASAAWEIAGETTLPSVNDQVTTTVAGMVIGEAFHRISGMILDGGHGPWRVAAATLFGPIETVNRALLGTPAPDYAPRSRVVARTGALAFDDGSDGKPRAAAVPDFGVRLSYGLPGDPELRLDSPFDRFELEASYSLERDPVASVIARGVLAGKTFERDAVGGLAGLVLQFDFTALGHIGASTSAVGLAAEARWELAPDVALEGTAVASAVMIGAAGFLPDRTQHQRTYRFGPGGQGELGLELRALDRIAARVGARQYVIVGMGDTPGVERITYGTGSLLFRLFGRSAVGVEALYAYRAADPGFGSVTTDHARVLRAFYAWGNDAMTR